MAMGRNLRVYHNLPHCGPATPYSLVLEQRGVSEILLVENYAIVPLGEYEEAPFLAGWQSRDCEALLKSADPRGARREAL